MSERERREPPAFPAQRNRRTASRGQGAVEGGIGRASQAGGDGRRRTRESRPRGDGEHDVRAGSETGRVHRSRRVRQTAPDKPHGRGDGDEGDREEAGATEGGERGRSEGGAVSL